jgi:hypothetical protein
MTSIRAGEGVLTAPATFKDTLINLSNRAAGNGSNKAVKILIKL